MGIFLSREAAEWQNHAQGCTRHVRVSTTDGSVQINRKAAPPGGWEEFTIEDRGNNVVCLKSCHGKYLSAQQDGTAQWNRDHAPPGGWEDIQFVPQVTQNQEQVSIKQQDSIEILEAVTGKPVRFKLNSPPNHNDAWVGIYPTGAIDQERRRPLDGNGLRDIDANNASFPNQVAGSHSIRVSQMADTDYTNEKTSKSRLRMLRLNRLMRRLKSQNTEE